MEWNFQICETYTYNINYLFLFLCLCSNKFYPGNILMFGIHKHRTVCVIADIRYMVDLYADLEVGLRMALFLNELSTDNNTLNA